MPKVSTTLSLVAVAILFVLGLTWLSARHTAPAKPRIDTSNALFLAIAPKIAFVDAVARPWLKTATMASGLVRPEPAVNEPPEDPDHPPAERTTLVAQSRALVTLAVAHDLSANDHSGDRTFKTALIKSGDFLLNHFHDPQTKNWRLSVYPDGSVAEPEAGDEAIAALIYGLSHAYRVTGEPRFLHAATLAWQQNTADMLMVPQMAETAGGEDLVDIIGPKPQALMHLLEALLALHDVTDDPMVLRDAQLIAKYAFKHLFDKSSGVIREHPAGSIPLVDTATADHKNDYRHQFTWAFLVSRTVEKGLSPAFLPLTNAVVDPVKIPGKIEEAPTDVLRTLAHFAVLRDRPDLWPVFETVYRAVSTAEAASTPEEGQKNAAQSAIPTDDALRAAELYAEIARLQALPQE